MGKVKVYCICDELVDTKSLKDHPKNRNKHPQEQIQRLAKLYESHGIRHPIIVSKNSGFIVAGHGRRLAALLAGVERFPVVYQSFDSEEAEYAFIQSDNAIALWSTLDIVQINEDLVAMGANFDADLLGLKPFLIESGDSFDANAEWKGMPEFDQKDKRAFKTIQLHFHDQDAINKFVKLTGVTITESTRYLWYPEIIIERLVDKRYGQES